MAKQTFTTGQVLTAAQMTALQQTAMLGGAANAKVASYVLVAADAGDAITMNNASPTTITVNTGLFAEGDIVTIINLGAGACTITAGTATVTTSGSLVLATNQGGVLRFTSASAAIFFQFATPASGDIEGVTAGTGISGGGTSGTVTITNSMATAIDAKGDLIVGTGADTFARLPVGANTYTLVADSSTATGLKWAAPAGGGMTSLASGSLPAANVLNLTSISADYKDLRLVIRNAQHASGSGSGMGYRLNGQGAGGEYNPRLNINSELGVGAGSDSTRIPLTSNDAKKDENITIQINIFDYANTSTNKRWQHSITYMKQGTTTWESNFQIGQYKFDNSAINQIQLYMDSSFSAGTYELIGIK